MATNGNGKPNLVKPHDLPDDYENPVSLVATASGGLSNLRV